MAKRVRESASARAKARADRIKETREELAEIRKSKDKSSRTSIILGVILGVAVTALLLTMLFQFDNMQAVGETFARIAKGSNWMWLLVAFALTLVYFLLWPLTITTYSKELNLGVGFRDAYDIGACEHFYNNVTPSYSGGQPFQVYAFKVVGANTGKATGAIIATFLTYLAVTNLYAFVALVFYPTYMTGVAESGVTIFNWAVTSDVFFWITLVGYFMNTLTLVMTCLIGASRTIRKWLVSFAMWLSKLKVGGRWVRKNLHSFVAYLRNTQEGFKEVWSHPKTFMLAFLYRLLAMGCFYAVPFFLLLSVGLPIIDYGMTFLFVMFGTSFAITAMCWLPTPGSTGGIELAFTVVLASLLCTDGLIDQEGIDIDLSQVSLTISLLWRLFTYYLVTIMSLGYSVVFQIRVQRRKRKEVKMLAAKEKELSASVEGESPEAAADPPDEKKEKAPEDGDPPKGEGE